MTRLEILLGALALGFASAAPAAAQRPAPHHYALTGNTRGKVTAVVSQFELAYMHQDKQQMLMRLMVPSSDAETLEKRYQWLRGYGPHDMPGSVHPPILFKTSKGSFVPASYSLLSEDPVSPDLWHVRVRETGTYHDEDGRYHVVRVRDMKIVRFNGRWYVGDYYIKANPEDYGFYVDDIIDKMTPLQGHQRP